MMATTKAEETKSVQIRLSNFEVGKLHIWASGNDQHEFADGFEAYVKSTTSEQISHDATDYLGFKVTITHVRNLIKDLGIVKRGRPVSRTKPSTTRPIYDGQIGTDQIAFLVERVDLLEKAIARMREYTDDSIRDLNQKFDDLT